MPTAHRLTCFGLFGSAACPRSCVYSRISRSTEVLRLSEWLRRLSRSDTGSFTGSEVVSDVKVLKDYFHFVAVGSRAYYSCVTRESQSAPTTAARVRAIIDEWARKEMSPLRLPGIHRRDRLLRVTLRRRRPRKSNDTAIASAAPTSNRPPTWANSSSSLAKTSPSK